MKRIIAGFVVLIASMHMLHAKEKQNFQTEYPHVKGYLKKYNRKLDNLSGELLICTLPRSGTNLTMSILSQLTGRDCFWGLGSWSKGIVFNRAKAKTDPNIFPILGSHKPNFFSNLRKNTLIITLRDYKEYFCRSGELEITDEAIKKYLDILNFFDHWNSEKRYIVNYDDLIDDPVTTIEELANFLDAPMERVGELLVNYEDFRARVLQSYYVFPKGTQNKGIKSNFHQAKFSEQKLIDLGERLKATNPYLFNKYLKRY